MEATKQLILRLSAENHKALKMLSVAMGKTMTDVVNGWIEQAKKTFIKSEIPIRDFTDEEVNQMIANDDKYCEENPELLKWARESCKEHNK